MYIIRFKDTNEVIEAYDRNLKHSENQASVLTFNLLPSSSFFSKIERFITKIVVYDNQKEVFDGHVINIEDSMASNGEFTYKITCLSVLDYLNNISTGKWSLHPGKYTPEEDDEEKNLDPFEIYENMDIRKTLELVLNKYNIDAREDEKIFLGNVTIEDNVYIQSNRSKILNFIQELASKKEAFLRIRKENEKYYLDFLKEVVSDENKITLGVNMVSLSRSSNLENIITRIIPLGADGLTIKSVNNNVEYVQNDELISKYGINDVVLKWDDVTVAENLKKKALEKLKTINEETFSISADAIDLSYIDNNYSRFEISQMVNISNSVLNINEKYRLVELDIDMDNLQNTSFTFSIEPCSAVTSNTDIAQQLSGAELTIEVIKDTIIRKISKGDLETVITASAEGWGLSINGKLKGKSYTFDIDKFKIGSTENGDTAEHTNSYSKWKHSNGEYSEARASGFFRNGRPYHNLVTIGTAIVGGSAGAAPSSITIQLPDEFKGKEFEVVCQTVDTQGGIELEYVKRIYLNVTSIDKINGKFTVRGYWTSIYNGVENEKELQFSYIAVGG